MKTDIKVTKETATTLQKIDADFERIYTEMLTELGDEAHDIGDSSDSHDLLLNRTSNQHDEQRDVEFLEALARIARIDPLEIMKAFIDLHEVARRQSYYS